MLLITGQELGVLRSTEEGFPEVHSLYVYYIMSIALSRAYYLRRGYPIPERETSPQYLSLEHMATICCGGGRAAGL
jgi:hypothetical protein